MLELRDPGAWTRLNYASTFDTSHRSFDDNVPRIDCRTISQNDFIEMYEKPLKPVVLTGCQQHWLARRKWTLNVRFCPFKSQNDCL